MTDYARVAYVVLRYARANPNFVSPDSITSSIQPAPSSMDDDQLAAFYNSLTLALKSGGIDARPPFASVTHWESWDDIAREIIARENVNLPERSRTPELPLPEEEREEQGPDHEDSEEDSSVDEAEIDNEEDAPELSH